MAAVISTERMILRRLTPDDAAGPYLRWMNDPAVSRLLVSPRDYYSEADLRAFIESVNADPASLFLAMVLKADSRHVGNIKLGPIHQAHGRADIGLIVGETSEWGKGLGTEAIRAVASYAFTMLGMHKVTAGCYGNNPGSARAFIKAGFTAEAVRRDHYRLRGQWVDELLFGLVKHD